MKTCKDYQLILASIKPERMLRVRRIKPRTLLAYDMYVRQFLDWCKRSHRSVTTSRAVDGHLACYFNMLFDDGEAMSIASYTLFGWITLKMVPRCPERDLLPLARAALTAWRGVKVGKARVGVPPSVIFEFANFCVRRNQTWGAAAVLVQYDLYARPSEVLGISGRDLVPPVRMLSINWGVLFGNADFSETTKTVVSDDVVHADSPHRGYCNKILQALGRKFAKQDVKIFDHSLEQYEALFREFSKLHKLQPGVFTPHCIRHSGPSFDAIHNLRTLRDIQSRGRWTCAASVARYKKPGRLLLEASKLPLGLRCLPSTVQHDTLSRVLSLRWD